MDYIIRVMTELTGEPWISIIHMPYSYLLKSIEWKIKLEEQRASKMNKVFRKDSEEHMPFIPNTPDEDV